MAKEEAAIDDFMCNVFVESSAYSLFLSAAIYTPQNQNDNLYSDKTIGIFLYSVNYRSVHFKL